MTTSDNGAGTDHVQTLVDQREQLRAWIARLDEVQTGAPSRVTERVRADYEDRLRRVDEELSAHGEEIQRNLDALREELSVAEERRGHAADALEETRLRHLIGELDGPAWETARAPLEQDVADAEQAVAATRAEVERLSSLADGIVGAPAAEQDEDDAPSVDAFVTGEDTGFAAGEEDAGDDLPFFGAEEAPAPAPAAETVPDEAGSGEWEPELEFAGGEAQVEPEAAQPAADDASLSGAELAAWISQVEAEAGPASAEPAQPEPAPEPEQPAPPTMEDVDGWDPFANEFGGSPAAPTTQPGDAAQDLPWLDSLQGGAAGQWAQQASGSNDDLAFLDNLDQPAVPAGEQPASGDLAADDLAFLEELDRAISGGAQRPAAGGAAPAQEGGGLGDAFQGGSGGGIVPQADGITQEQPRKRGEALLCKECGAINEPQAWYCEICGSEL